MNERSHRYSVERRNRNSCNESEKNKTQEKEEIPQDRNIKQAEQDKQTEQKPAEQDKQVEDGADESASKEEMMKLAMEAKANAEERIKSRLELREKNLRAPQGRPDESFFKQLDSSMKKNTAFVKKLKAVTEVQRDALVTEFNVLNLNKFIQEAVTSIVEAKIKVSDVGAAAYMCSLFHQRYTDFTPLLKLAIVKLFEGIHCKEEEKSALVPRLRTATRLIGELILDGVYTCTDEGLQLLVNILQSLMNADKSSFSYAPVMLTIVRHCGEDLAGIVGRKYREWKEEINVEIPVLSVLSSDQKSMFLCLFKEYYENMANHLVSMHKDVQLREKQNRQTIGLKGELPPDKKETFEKLQKTYDKLLSSATSLSELLDEDMPDLPQDESDEREDLGTINIFTPARGVEYDSENGLWEDDDTRLFYEDIKDLKVLVPQILFKDQPANSPASSSPNNTKKTQKQDNKKKKERKLRVDLNVDEDDMLEFNDFNDPDDNYEQDVLGDDGDEDEPVISGMAAVAEQYFQSLPNCINRDFIDQAAEDFIMKLNTKGNRKKLVRTLFTVNRVRLDLLPFYARLVATLCPCLPEVGSDIIWLLKGSFRSHLRKKDQIHTESKVKTVRFIGELTKFKICPKAEALHCLKVLLANFTHHNIDMACNLLETCGRFLYRSPESYPRMFSLLEQLMRKKSVQTFDSRHLTMIENAFYYCNPPERQQIQKVVRPPLHEYIRKILYKDLSKTTTEKVLRQIRKLPWSDEEVKAYATSCLIKVWNVKFNNIRCVSNMLSGLAEYHDDVSLAVIDGVLENVRIGMETNMFRDNQRRLSTVKYLGEMYNYQLIDSDIIFNSLYLLITFGATLDSAVSELDPPEHLFRIRLVCTLLDTCGQYFSRGSSKKKMDCFLIYFQHYIWQKRSHPCWNEDCPFPKEVDYMICDSVEGLRPKMALYSSLEEAHQAIMDLNKEYEDKIKAISTVNETAELSDLDTSNLSGNNLSGNNLSGNNLSGNNLSGSPFCDSPVAFSNFSQSSQDDEFSEFPDQSEDSGDEMEETSHHNIMEQDEMFTMDSVDEIHLREAAPKLYKCEEDELFCKEFDRLLGDSLTDRLHDSTKVSHVDIAIPMNLKGKQKKGVPTSEESNGDGVNFVLMLKKNNKQVLKGLNIPLTSDLAANIRNKQLAERAEHEEMKKLVLDYNQRQEEESYNELMSQFRPTKKGSTMNYRHLGGGGANRQPHKGGQSRLRSYDGEQTMFTPSNRR